MTPYYSELEKLLNTELVNIEKSTFDIFKRYELMAHASVGSYGFLKEKLKKHHFKDIESEIHFFKYINPKAISKIHYYSLIIKFLNHSSGFATIKEKKCHCKKLLKQIALHFSENQYIISYYKSNRYNLDEKYFLRSCSDYPFVLEDCHAFIDKETTTGYDLIIARYLAYSQFSEFIQNEMHISNSGIKTPHLGIGGGFLNWTGSKSELIELMYAIHAKGSINNNQLSVTDLAKAFEQVFQVELGEYFHAFSEFKNRKNQTLYIDNLRKALVSKFDEKEF
jgi:hypothetical protein